MKFLVLFIAAASAVTIYPGDDSLAQESHGETSREQLRGRRTRFLTENSSELKAALSGRPRQHRKEENRLEHPKSLAVPEGESHEGPSYFANALEGGGHKLGYSTFIQHHGEESDVTQEGSMEIKKVVPKSSVQVEMYHGPAEAVPQQPHKHHVKQEHKEVTYPKLKNKPPKYYQESVPSYKKPKPSQVYISSTPSLLVKDLSSTTPSYATAGVTKYKNTHSSPEKRKPFSGRQQYKGHENLVNYSHKNEEVTHKPIVHFQLHGTSDKKNPGWKALSETVEIASSNDYIAKQPKVRKPKEVLGTSFPSHAAFYDQEPERFKAERFDHEKALRSSTSFGMSNAVGFGPSTDFGGEDASQGNVFNLHSEDFLKALEPEAGRGPVTFQPSEQGNKKIKNFPTRGFQIPIMTEEEFEKNFGKIDKYRKPEIKFGSGKRLQFDARSLQNNKATSAKPVSFSQYNTGSPEWAPQGSVPKQHSPEPSFKQVQSSESSYKLNSHESSFKPVHSSESTFKLHSPESSYKQLHAPESSYQHFQSPETSYKHLQSPEFKLHSQESSFKQLHSPESSFKHLHTPESSFKHLHSQESNSYDSFPAYSFNNQHLRRNISIVPDRVGKVFSENGHEPQQQYSVSASYQIDRAHEVQ